MTRLKLGLILFGYFFNEQENELTRIVQDTLQTHRDNKALANIS